MMLCFKQPTHFCLLCFKMLDVVSGPWTNEPPVPGDLTVCIGCGSLMTWDTEMRLIPSDIPDDAEPILKAQVQALREKIDILIAQQKSG